MNKLKELPEGWKWVELQDIAEVTSSRRIFQSDYVQEGIPFYRTKEVKELSEGKEIKIELFISSEKYALIKAKNPVPKIGDILLSAVGTIGVSYIIKNEDTFYFKDGNLIWVRNLKNVISKYLDYNFAHFIKFQQSILTSGSAYNALTIIKLKKYLIPLPPLTTQQSIVSKIEELFSELDKSVENLKTAQQQLKVYRQAVLKWAFEGKLTSGLNQDANDVADEYDLAMVAEPEGVYQTANDKANQNAEQAGLFEGWKYKRLGDMFNFVGGGTPSKSEPSYWNGDINWASVKDVKGDYLIKTQDYITEIGLKNSASNLAQIGDVILITRISPGKAIISKIITSINQDLKIAKPRFETTSSFVKYFFNALERQCIKVASGTTVLGITLNNLNELLIPDLSLGEQTQIVEEIERRLSVADKMEESIQQSLLQAESLRQSILKKAFEGELIK
ncbi:hypothetical protein EZJ43_13785 [Pedobacter changchengzhani]|uniref:Type I restriction modification DNA specificity domain-containing protein n=1 Tax=Pedobacter changchengzhani TaxID=2529274 RepID=A0A4R5MJV4_9SPHI|nr:restriction endonuclease subunit S [Pedobacter changchengzhani]TDG35369.1 hypothetical protein EZJ43_13785 [Pedobacter changchengzhani]